MDKIEKFAIITAEHPIFGSINIKISREIPLREIIRNLFDALGYNLKSIKGGFYAKAEVAEVLIYPTDTLKDRNIYDGDILHIL